ncbi:MAG: hypothetical protein DI587_18555 [Variovorax paradoxus]|nr:MAG: hypothetical protein DI583_18555 [Variovorax paradoxus]PZQ08467.1 MAG: hypothetical protein DI587_18555 [Variovorax paradoxus]
MTTVGDLEAQWEDAARKADGLAALLQARVKMGQPAPEDLVASVAAAEEDVLVALLRIEAARGSRPL